MIGRDWHRYLPTRVRVAAATDFLSDFEARRRPIMAHVPVQSVLLACVAVMLLTAPVSLVLHSQLPRVVWLPFVEVSATVHRLVHSSGQMAPVEWSDELTGWHVIRLSGIVVATLLYSME